MTDGKPTDALVDCDDADDSFASVASERGEPAPTALVPRGSKPEPFDFAFAPLDFRPHTWPFYVAHRRQVLAEVLAGLTVGFAQVPESVAFAFVAGVSPAVSLHGTWVRCQAVARRLLRAH